MHYLPKITLQDNFEHQKSWKIKQLQIQMILPRNSKSLWQAVKISKDVGISTLPKIMKYGDSDVTGIERLDCFARFFSEKSIP